MSSVTFCESQCFLFIEARVQIAPSAKGCRFVAYNRVSKL